MNNKTVKWYEAVAWMTKGHWAKNVHGDIHRIYDDILETLYGTQWIQGAIHMTHQTEKWTLMKVAKLDKIFKMLDVNQEARCYEYPNLFVYKVDTDNKCHFSFFHVVDGVKKQSLWFDENWLYYNWEICENGLGESIQSVDTKEKTRTKSRKLKCPNGGL